MLPELITGGVFTAAMLWLGLLYYGKRTLLAQTLGQYAIIIEKAMQSERDRAAAITELDFLKQSIVVLMGRPVLANLTDGQVAQINQSVAQIVLAGLKPKEQLN